jgi:hypothetical protein
MRRAFVLFATFAIAAGSQALDRQDWIDRYERFEPLYTAQWSDDAYFANSQNLAYSESMILRSYVEMYRTTGDREYLHRFTRRADRMIAAASDINGDGFLGWGGYRFAVSLARNGGFEETDPGDSTLPRQWARVETPPHRAFRIADGGRVGASIVLRPSPDQPAALESPLRNDSRGLIDNRAYEPNTWYELAAWGRMTGAAGYGRVAVVDLASGEELAAIDYAPGPWQFRLLHFRTPSDGRSLVVRVNAVGEGEFRADNVHVRQYAEYLVHDALIGKTLLEFAAVVLGPGSVDRRLRSSTELEARARLYRGFVHEQIMPKWSPYYRPVGGAGGVYILPDDGSTAHPNQSAAVNWNMAAAAMHLWSGDEAHRARALEIASAYLPLFDRFGSAYRWFYFYEMRPGDDPTNTFEDISHANPTIEFVLDAVDHGLLVEDEGMRLGRTFLDVIWNRSTTDPELSYALVGHPFRIGPYAFISGWASLTPYAMDVWHVIDRMYENHRYDDIETTSAFVHRPSQLLTMARLIRWASLRNRGFEVADLQDGHLPLGWSRPNSSGRTVFRTPLAARQGGFGARVTTDPARGWQTLEQRFTTYPLGIRVPISAMVRTNRPKPGGVIEVIDLTDQRVLATLPIRSHRWTRVEGAFETPPVSGHDIRLRVRYANPNLPRAIVDVDALSLGRF